MDMIDNPNGKHKNFPPSGKRILSYEEGDAVRELAVQYKLPSCIQNVSKKALLAAREKFILEIFSWLRDKNWLRDDENFSLDPIPRFRRHLRQFELIAGIVEARSNIEERIGFTIF